jgi:hypothetical protein
MGQTGGDICDRAHNGPDVAQFSGNQAVPSQRAWIGGNLHLFLTGEAIRASAWSTQPGLDPPAFLIDQNGASWPAASRRSSHNQRTGLACRYCGQTG